jgi:hypothetical protein
METIVSSLTSRILANLTGSSVNYNNNNNNNPTINTESIGHNFAKNNNRGENMHDIDELEQSVDNNDNNNNDDDNDDDDDNNNNNNDDDNEEEEDDDDDLVEVESFSEDNSEYAQSQQNYSQQPNPTFSVEVRGNNNSIKRGGNKVNKTNNNPNDSYNTYNIHNTIVREPTTQVANGPSK